jgi:hypothetical protein
MAHEDQFTATGPAFEGAGFPRAAFSTGREGTDSTYGVNVQGSECGVYGEGGNVNDTGRTPSFPANAALPGHNVKFVNTGVCGRGTAYGVFGEGDQRAGVYGRHSVRKGAGVMGVGTKGATGIIGASVAPDPDPSSFQPNAIDSDSVVGVLGATNIHGGSGVMGLSTKSLPEDFPVDPDIPRPKDTEIPARPERDAADGDGIGVTGLSGEGVGVLGSSKDGVGVIGISRGSIGVVGQSGTGRGGVFETGFLAPVRVPVAQVRLVPVVQNTSVAQLPKLGKVGDLLMISKYG